MGLFISLEKYAMQKFSPHSFTTHAIIGKNVWKFVEKNNTKASHELLRAICQNCSVKSTIHIATCYHNCSKYVLHLQKQKISMVRLKNSADAFAQFYNYMKA